MSGFNLWILWRTIWQPLVDFRQLIKQEVVKNTEFLYGGPIGLLYYAGPTWTLLAILVFLGLLFFVITRMNRS